MRFMGRTLDFTQNGPKMGPLIGRMLRGCCTLRALGTHPSTYSLIYKEKMVWMDTPLWHGTHGPSEALQNGALEGCQNSPKLGYS